MTPILATGAPPRASKAYPYGVEWLCHNVPRGWAQGSMQAVYVRARNTGTRVWRASADGGKCVDLVMRFNGTVQHMARVPHDVPPGAPVTFGFALLVPFVLFRSAAETEISFNLVEQNVAWFHDHGVESLTVPVETLPAEAGAAAEALQVGGMTCNAFYLPSGGVSRGRDGKRYPLFARDACGCRVRDLEGNEWIDYVMGWGSALLGYARPEISAAIGAELGSGSVLGLPHALELEVAQRLCETIPCCEATLFGKNGSDVCTAAVRIARMHTGRPNVLFSGYSGWQEPFAQAFEPGLAQPGHAQTAFRFTTGDMARVRALFAEHAGQVAAVILEPAAQVEGVDGPVRDADPAFLRALADTCRQHGALLIFDEIMTGFRYPGGSVQKATGVVPDLACFGKALTSAMPLSVLVGRRDVMKSVGRIFYHPTFKGEAYSFAAAAAALRIYENEDVPGRVAAFGRRLMDSVNEASRRAGVDGALVGLPFRMVYRFNEPDAGRRTLMRTLLQQELLKRGVLSFRGFLLPSTAHGDAELEQTTDAFEAALRRVAEVGGRNCFEEELEIPPVV
jgi:glutamate-1-semialdehyde 2,1-aminomutase